MVLKLGASQNALHVFNPLLSPDPQKLTFTRLMTTLSGNTVAMYSGKIHNI